MGELARGVIPPLIRTRTGARRLYRFLPALTFLVAAALVIATVYVTAFRANISQLQGRGEVQMTQAAERLLGQMAPFQQLPTLLSRHPLVVGLVNGTADPEAANAFLINTALTVGADQIFVLSRDGTVLGASDFENPDTQLGRSYAPSGYVRRALSGGLGVQHGTNPDTGAREFLFARGIIEGTAPPVGVVIVRVNVAQLEFEWQNDRNVITFLDSAGVVFVTNRVQLPLMRDPVMAALPVRTELHGTTRLTPFLDYRIRETVLGTLWRFSPNEVIPRDALAMSMFLPRIGMTVRVFLDTAPVAASARLLAYLAAAVLALIGVGLWALGQRRRRLTDRLATEAAANARLEAAVEERTEQLRRTQDQLVQAGKLTALGQMSAGISHELNQPLAAIRNFAENGVRLIERDRISEARGNLDQIAEQADRAGRIIRNLRAFARKEPETTTPVDLQTVIDDALRMIDQQATAAGVTITRSGDRAPVRVMGGQVRLQQVFLNLLGNAIDALEQVDDKAIDIRIDGTTAHVRDTGPGLADPARVFEPFYTTKDVGASKGLGLGLSISYGIVGSFGGVLTCRNLDRGAEFSVRLQGAPA